MKIAILNDTHAGIRNASDIFADNAEQFYSKIFFPYCLENNITQILHLGDYYDNRRAVHLKTIHRNRKMFLEKMRDYGMKMDIIPGNHDVAYKNTNTLNSLKELLGHYMNEIHLIMNPTVLEYGSTKIAMLPWINSENYDKSIKFIKNCKADILAGHLDLNGFNLMKGVVNTHGMDPKLFSRFELVLSGHFHTKSQKDNIMYLGSQMEFFWSDAQDPKYFHVLDTETRELEAIHNPYTLFEKIYYNDKVGDPIKSDISYIDKKFVKIIVINKSDTFLFDKFVEKVQQRDILELKIAENFSEFLGDNVRDEKISVEDTSKLLESYIEAVDTDFDKNRIKESMGDLYKEAQVLEIA